MLGRFIARSWLALFLVGGLLLSASGREWRLDDGSTIEGEVERVTEAMVVLRKPDGSRAMLSRDRLSEEDRAYLAGRSGVPEVSAAPSPSQLAPRPARPSDPAVPSRPEPPSQADLLEPLHGHPGVGHYDRGDEAPSFGFRDTVSGELRSLEELRGRLTVVLFWSPNVSQSIRPMVEMRRYHAANPELFHLVTVAPYASSTNARSYMRDADPSPLPHVLGDPRLNVTNGWGVSALPTCVLIDANGYILSEHVTTQQFVELLRQRLR